MSDEMKVLQNTDFPALIKLGEDNATPFPHLWQSAGRVSGSTCVKDTRMPVWAMLDWVAKGLLDRLSDEQWNAFMKQNSSSCYSREQVNDCLSYASNFFHQTRLDLTNPLVLMTLELLTHSLFLNKEGRVNENTPLTSFKQPDFFNDDARKQLDELTQHLIAFLEKLKQDYDAIARSHWEEMKS